MLYNSVAAIVYDYTWHCFNLTYRELELCIICFETSFSLQIFFCSLALLQWKHNPTLTGGKIKKNIIIAKKLVCLLYFPRFYWRKVENQIWNFFEKCKRQTSFLCKLIFNFTYHPHFLHDLLFKLCYYRFLCEIAA